MKAKANPVDVEDDDLEVSYIMFSDLIKVYQEKYKCSIATAISALIPLFPKKYEIYKRTGK